MASKYIKLPVEPVSSNGGVASDVNVLSSALPTGASTSAQQTSTNTKLDTVTAKQDVQTSLLNFIETDLQASNTSLSSINTKLPTGLTVTTGRLQVELPAGSGGLTDTQLRATPVAVSGTVASTVSGTVAVSNFPATQAVSGTVAVSNPGLTDTQLRATPVAVSGTVSTGGLTNTELRATALPVSLTSTTVTNTVATTLASTTITGSVAVTGPLTDVQLRATPVPISGSVTSTVSGTVAVSNFPATQAVSGTVTVANPGLTDTQLRATALPVSLASTTITGSVAVTGPLTDTQIRATALPVSLASTTVTNTVATSSASLPLPTGASTSALQTTANSSLSSIDTKTPALGQALAAASTPVVLTAAQIATLTPLTSLTITQATGTNLHAVIDSGNINAAVTGTVSVSNFPATQAVSGTVAVSNPGLTDTQLRATPVAVSGTLAVTGGLTDTQLRASAVPVSLASTTITNFPATQSVTGTFFQATQPVSLASTTITNFPATQAVSGTVAANATLSAETTKVIGTVNISAGQTIATTGGLTDTQIRATALPVSLASTTVTNTVATTLASTTITGSVAVTGPLTDTQLRAVAVPVSLASTTVTNTVATSSASLPLPAGASTSANQTTTNASLASIDAKTPALVSGSQPVAVQASVVPADVSVTGNLTNGTDTVVLSTSGESTSLFEVGGTWVGTFIFESSNNNFTTFQPVAAVFLGGLATQSSSFSANGFYSVLTAGFQKVRVRFSVFTSGTATILANAAAGNRISVAMQGNPNNLQTLAAQGAAGAAAWKVDGSAVTQPVSIAGTVTTTGGLTDTQLRATALPVSGTVSANATLTAETTKVIGTVNISAAQSVLTTSPSVVSSTNSSTVALAANAVFTGASEQVQDYATLQVSVFSDQASAALGLSVQQSSNGTNWDILDIYTVPAATGKIFSFVPAARFFRIVYTNGATVQAAFRLQTVYHYAFAKGSTHSFAESITVQNDAQLTIAQVRGLNGVNALPLLCDVSGNLQTALIGSLNAGVNTIGAVATVDGLKTTYSAATFNSIPAALATDIFTITGSATKTIRINRIVFTATQSTSGQVSVVYLRRSTANTVGTSTAVTAVTHDTTNAAATATVLVYTANPTVGTLVGNLRAKKVFVGAANSTSDERITDFGTRNSQAIVLRGVAQVFAVNLAGVTVTGGNFSITVEWTEE